MRRGGARASVATRLATSSGGPGAEGPPLVLGSHFDTVRDAGRYDGVLGVLCAIEVAEALGTGRRRSRWSRSPTRREPATASPTSAARPTAAGSTRPGLRSQDEDGVAMAAAIESGGRRRRRAARPTATACYSEPAGAAASLGYLEVHIEQGPVLESEGAPRRRGHRDRRADAWARDASRAVPDMPARCPPRCVPTRLPALPSSCSRSRRRCTASDGLVATVGRLDGRARGRERDPRAGSS